MKLDGLWLDIHEARQVRARQRSVGLVHTAIPSSPTYHLYATGSKV